MDQNSSNLVGRLADEPKYYANAEESKCRTWFRLAVNRGGRKDKVTGKPLVDYHPVTVFGKKAIAVANHCHKGKEVSITGELHENSRPITLADGTPLVHPETNKPLYDNYYEVLASKVSFGRDSEKWKAAQAALQAQGAQAPAPSATFGAAPQPAPQAAPVAPAPQAVSAELLASVTQGVMASLAAEQSAAQAPAPVAPAANPLGAMS